MDILRMDHLIKVDHDKNIYVYQHLVHAQCSSVTFTQIKAGSAISVSVNILDHILECSREDHHALLPFFMTNKSVLLYISKN